MDKINCPTTCQIMEKAFKANAERNVGIKEFIEYHKKNNMFCQMCRRNEYSTLPGHMKNHS